VNVALALVLSAGLFAAMQSNVMKLAMAICSAIRLAGAAQVTPSAAKHSAAADARAAAIMPNVGDLMAKTQTSLAQAEALYDKAVQGGKANFSQLLTAQAGAMAGSIRTYADSLSKASAKVELAVNTARAGVASNASKKFVSFAQTEGVATLSAKADSLASEARRMSRLQRSAQERVVAQAVQQLADTEDVLSRKLGDLSTMSEDAKAIVQAAGPGDESLPASKTVAAVPKPAITGQPASLAELSKNLAAVKTAAKVDTTTAEKQIAAAMSQASAQLGAGANKIKAALEVAEKEEISRVKANKVDKEPPRPRHRHHGHRHS